MPDFDDPGMVEPEPMPDLSEFYGNWPTPEPELMPDLSSKFGDRTAVPCFPSLGETCGQCHRCNPHVHGDWDAGGYCNKLIMRDGYGDTCGYQQPSLKAKADALEEQLNTMIEPKSTVELESNIGKVIMIPQSPSIQPVIGRDDAFHTWLKRHRDQHVKNSYNYHMIDTLCNLYTLHSDTGTPLDQPLEGNGVPADE